MTTGISNPNPASYNFAYLDSSNSVNVTATNATNNTVAEFSIGAQYFVGMKYFIVNMNALTDCNPGAQQCNLSWKIEVNTGSGYVEVLAQSTLSQGFTARARTWVSPVFVWTLTTAAKTNGLTCKITTYAEAPNGTATLANSLTTFQGSN